jgi:tRNA 2-thiouridine synthesizing protein A
MSYELAACLVPDRLLDARGATGPSPHEYALDELGQMAPGEVLEVLTDNPPSIHTIPFYAKQQGHQLMSEPLRQGAVYRLFLRAGGR